MHAQAVDPRGTQLLTGGKKGALHSWPLPLPGAAAAPASSPEQGKARMRELITWRIHAPADVFKGATNISFYCTWFWKCFQGFCFFQGREGFTLHFRVCLPFRPCRSC